MENTALAATWNYMYSVGDPAGPNPVAASQDVNGFYCPSRRNRIRNANDSSILLVTTWSGGGTDYGGCIGRGGAFNNSTDQESLTSGEICQPNFYPAPFTSANDGSMDEAQRWGIFGRVNQCTTIAEIRDGTSCTIMTGELQRFTDPAFGTAIARWMGRRRQRDPLLHGLHGLQQQFRRQQRQDVDNGYFGSPGSDHPTGANFGLGDASVRFLIDTMDPSVFALMGSMANGVATTLPP